MTETGGDLVHEFKAAKPPEKAVIIGGIVAVIGIAWYLYRRGVGGSSATPAQSGTPAIQQAGYPSVGANGTPVLPSGVNPVYDPSGNLVAFQNPPPPTPPPTKPANWFTNLLGNVGYGQTIRPGGIDANGQRFWIGKTGNSNMFYAPVGSQIAYGAQGRVWLTPPGGTQQLLTGPGAAPTTSKLNTSSTQVSKTAAGIKH